jgi:hypothetical protein
LAEIKLSDFTMFKTAPYKLPDPKSIITAVMGGIKEEEKTFGSVFTAKCIKYTLKFIAEKIGEKPPEDIQTLDQLIEYLVSKSSIYPKPWCAAIYGQIHVEYDLQGQMGAGARVFGIGVSRFVEKKAIEKVRGIDLEGALFKLRQAALALKIAPKDHGYRINADGSADMLWPDCPFRDVCEPAYYEGLLRTPDGKMGCGITTFVCQYYKTATGFEWDYERIETYKPYCIIKIFPV